MDLIAKDYIEEDLDELRCDYCQRLICYVYIFDLESSHFFCRSCVKKHGKTKK